MKVGQLIEIAIGYPEKGHVNFSALQSLLNCIVDRMGIKDEIVENYSGENQSICIEKLSNDETATKARLIAGAAADETAGDAASLAKDSGDANVPPQSNDANNYADIDDGETSDNENGLSRNQMQAIIDLKDRVYRIEMNVQSITVPENILNGLSVMKDQLQFIIEQMLLLTYLTLSKKPEHKQIQQLLSMTQALLEIREDNVFIEGLKRIQFPVVADLDWESSGLQLRDTLSENEVLESRSVASDRDNAGVQPSHLDDLDEHLCYSPSKLLDQLMELKSDFCLVTNKVNELSSRLLTQESQRTLALIQEMQELLRDMKLAIVTLKENQSRMELRIDNNESNIESIQNIIEEIQKEKVDKTDFEIQLASKVDYEQLQRKVSLDQIMEMQCRTDRKFGDMLQKINENEKKFEGVVENLKDSLGFAAINEVLNKFKENIEKDIRALRVLFQSYIDMTNDECAAAGARSKVLHNLACLSCDTNCVMRSREKAKVGILPNAHATNVLSPLISYELGSIRKSGIMGYYRKDEFPHAPNAWMSQQPNALVNLKHCVPRHAGGEHTSQSLKERYEKTMSIRK